MLPPLMYWEETPVPSGLAPAPTIAQFITPIHQLAHVCLTFFVYLLLKMWSRI
jgi:hypothetical protein